MSELLNLIRFFEEEIPVTVLREFYPDEGKFLANALKLGIPPNLRKTHSLLGASLPPSPCTLFLIMLMR